MVTDPPYGVEYDPLWRERAGLGIQKQRSKVRNDQANADWTRAYELFPGDVAYVWHASIHAGTVSAGLAAAGFDVRTQLVWVKQNFALSRGDYHWGHEPCWYAVRRQKKSFWNGDRTQSTVWFVDNLGAAGRRQQTPLDEKTGHGTQKPVELFARSLRNHKARDLYEPFSGSGTAFVAAEQLGRVCLGLEIEPAYVAVALERLVSMGLEPRLAGRA
jgi:DNA modification methylase